MPELVPFELHALRLGKIIGNLQSLELGARLFLDNTDTHRGTQLMSSLPTLGNNDWVPLCPLSDGSDLRQVLERFNKLAPEHRLEVDRIVRLRDALAHGRIFGKGLMQQDSTLWLLKFSREIKDEKVQVSSIEEMTESWFNDNIKFLKGSMERVRVALDWNSRNLKP